MEGFLKFLISKLEGLSHGQLVLLSVVLSVAGFVFQIIYHTIILAAATKIIGWW